MDDRPEDEPEDHDDAAGIAALERIAAELADVEIALRRLDEGTYGRCELCHGPIDDERLAEQPAARRCGAHEAGPGRG